MEEKGLASFQNLTTYFLKKGKLSKIETHVRSYLKSNLKKKKSKLLDQAQKSINKVIPYVRLLVRKRGKRFKYRVEYLEKKRGKRKAYLSIAKELSENKTSYFLNVLQKEIETVASKKSNLLVKKNTLHETAKFAIPYKWRKLRRLEKRKARRKALRKESKALKTLNFNKKNLEKKIELTELEIEAQRKQQSEKAERKAFRGSLFEGCIPFFRKIKNKQRKKDERAFKIKKYREKVEWKQRIHASGKKLYQQISNSLSNLK